MNEGDRRGTMCNMYTLKEREPVKLCVKRANGEVIELNDEQIRRLIINVCVAYENCSEILERNPPIRVVGWQQASLIVEKYLYLGTLTGESADGYVDSGVKSIREMLDNEARDREEFRAKLAKRAAELDGEI